MFTPRSMQKKHQIKLHFATFTKTQNTKVWWLEENLCCYLFTCLSFDPNDMLTLNKIWQCQSFHSSTTMLASKYWERRRNEKLILISTKLRNASAKTLAIETKWVLWVVPDPPQHIVNLACWRFSRLIVRTNTTLLEY